MNEAVTTPGLLRRLAAMAYDSLLVFSLLFAATGLYQVVARRIGPGAAAGVVNGDLATGDVVTGITPLAAGPGYTLYLFAIIGLFFVWFWHRSGQTLGMQAWRLRVDDIGGGRISYAQALLRFAGAWLSAICFGLGYLWILVDRDNCSWHDRLSRSRVVQLPKRKK